MKEKDFNKKTLDKYVQMVNLLCEGLDYHDISTKMKMDQAIVRQCFMRMRRKYKAKTTAQLIYILVRDGIIS